MDGFGKKTIVFFCTYRVPIPTSNKMSFNSTLECLFKSSFSKLIAVVLQTSYYNNVGTCLIFEYTFFYKLTREPMKIPPCSLRFKCNTHMLQPVVITT